MDFDWIEEIPESYMIKPWEVYAVNNVNSIEVLRLKFVDLFGEGYINWVRSIGCSTQSNINLFDNDNILNLLAKGEMFSFNFGFQWSPLHNEYILKTGWNDDYGFDDEIGYPNIDMIVDFDFFLSRMIYDKKKETEED